MIECRMTAFGGHRPQFRENESERKVEPACTGFAHNRHLTKTAKPRLWRGENRKFYSYGNEVMKSPWEPPRTLKETMMEAEFNHLNHATWECKYHVVFTVARQSGWEHSDNQDDHFEGRGGRMIVAARR
jgi:hypothetical protein